MITNLKLGWKIITYFATSKSKKGHGIHSPFVYTFTQEVLNNKAFPEKMREIENLRLVLKADTSAVTFVNYGAGSRKLGEGQLPLRKAHTCFSTRPASCRLLYSLARWLHPRTVIDMGTSFGFSAMYFCMAAPQADIYTVEANAPSLDIAMNHFHELNFTNFKPFHLRFDDFLDQFPMAFKHPVLVYLDGDHRKDATIRYVKKILPFISSDSCIAIADIYWSFDMYHAWKELTDLREVTCSIEMLNMGLLFFSKAMHKQHFKIRNL